MSEEPEDLSKSAQEVADDFADGDRKMPVAAIRKHYAEHAATHWKLVKDQFRSWAGRPAWLTKSAVVASLGG